MKLKTKLNLNKLYIVFLNGLLTTLAWVTIARFLQIEIFKGVIDMICVLILSWLITKQFHYQGKMERENSFMRPMMEETAARMYEAQRQMDHYVQEVKIIK